MKNYKRVIIYLLSAACMVALVLSIPSLKDSKEFKKAKNAGTMEAIDIFLYEHPDSKYFAEALELKDSMFYDLVQKSSEPAKCDDYRTSFPDGKHREEVLYRKAELLKGNVMEQFSAINEYLHAYPSGKYADKLSGLCDELWDEEIARYENRDKQAESAKAVKYMQEMLQYMKRERVNTICISVKPHLELKDYDEYSKDVRNLMEKNISWDTPFPQNLERPKSNFSQSNTEEFTSIIVDGVTKSMDRMFTPGFIKAVSDEKAGTAVPTLTFDYTIKSQDMNYGGLRGPEIWEWRDTPHLRITKGRVQGYLQGIMVSFKAVFTLPGSATTYEYKEDGNPGESIKTISRNNSSKTIELKKAYKSMTSACFSNFSEKMAANMGLK